jgi:mannose-6-phosphate isomerase
MAPLAFNRPIVFEPIFVERIWGGRRLERAFGKKLPAETAIGESWEIVDRAEVQSIVRLGPLRGRTLHELWLDHRAEIFGDELADAPRFPLLAKLLDAETKLSVQVHPRAEIAGVLGGEAKSEMWYFALVDPGAVVYAGLRRGVQRRQLEEALRDGHVADLLHRIKVKTGDAIVIPSGLLHAVGPGSLIVEISQNSDTTYRLFDWNRVGRDGRARELHVEQSFRSIDFNDFEPELIQPFGEELVRSPHFIIEKWDLTSARRACERRAFALFVCLSGTVKVNGMRIEAGEFFLLPASAAEAELQPAPATSLLRITLPPR